MKPKAKADVQSEEKKSEMGNQLEKNLRRFERFQSFQLIRSSRLKGYKLGRNKETGKEAKS